MDQPLMTRSDESSEYLSYSTPQPPHDRDDARYLIFFITGNPGLIGYYEDFLSSLSALLTSGPASFRIVGHSLAGFELAGSPLASSQHGLRHGPPYTLDEQITYIEACLDEAIETSAETQYGGDHQRRPCKVIFVGHSVGSYMLLEILRRRQRAAQEAAPIIGGILLFPTVTHIAKSPSGTIFTVRLRSGCFEQSETSILH